jgi:hypothetical protein
MFKALKPFIMDEKELELQELANWIWNSHNWVEEAPGYY